MHELCSKLGAMRETQLEPFLRLILSELKSALRQQTERLRKLAAAKLSKTVRGKTLGNIWLLPFRHLDDRVRELCSKLGAMRETQLEPFLRLILSELKSALRQQTEGLRKLAAANLSKTVRGKLHEGQCRRSIYPDGRAFWSFTWSRPAQGAMLPTVLNCSICNRPLQAEDSRADEDGQLVHGGCYVQRLVEAQGDPFDRQHAE
jgi:hypothetical protein